MIWAWFSRQKAELLLLLVGLLSGFAWLRGSLKQARKDGRAEGQQEAVEADHERAQAIRKRISNSSDRVSGENSDAGYRD